jgi:hypothetical protein
MSPNEDLAASRYVLLTTYRRDGTAVATPVWIVRYGADLAVWSAGGAGKVKRIQRTSRVTVATCNIRGHRPGPAQPGRAELLDPAGAAAVRRLIARKYAITGRLTLLSSRLQGGLERSVGIKITLGEPAT